MTNTSSLFSQLHNEASRLGDTSYVELPNSNEVILAYNHRMVLLNDKLAFLANSSHIEVRSELKVIHNLISLNTRAISEWLDQKLPLEQMVSEPPSKKQKLEEPVPNLKVYEEPQAPFRFPDLPEVRPEPPSFGVHLPPFLRNPLELRRTESLIGPSEHRFLEGMLSPNHESALLHSISQPTVEDVIDLTYSDSEDSQTVFFTDGSGDEFVCDLSFLDN